MYYSILENDLHDLIIVGDQNGITHIRHYTEEKLAQLKAEGVVRREDFFREAKSQLAAYFAGERKTFDLKLNPAGTPYQKAVWSLLTKIPYGTTTTYKDLAVKMGNSKASRAVGMCNGRNPIMIVIPCHRVIGSDGRLTGFAGGLEMKRDLLDLEAKGGKT